MYLKNYNSDVQTSGDSFIFGYHSHAEGSLTTALPNSDSQAYSYHNLQKTTPSIKLDFTKNCKICGSELTKKNILNLFKLKCKNKNCPTNS